LRAVAILLVLLYHAGLPQMRGGFVGVDVFFVISGFLITSQLVTEVGRTGSVSLVGFYARRAKRLLPAVGVVLVATVLLVRFTLPTTRWHVIGGDIVASALYVVNWRLADRSVDYLAEDVTPSPVQHFWSLAVEEQYYLVWPLLILVAAVVAKLLRGRVIPVLWIGLAAVAVPSFLWSLTQSANSPARAFFETTTRMWELGIGAAVALASVLLARLPRTLAIGIGWTGLAMAAVSGLIFTPDVRWPGYAAALPTVGAAAVIAGGFAAGGGGPAAVLGSWPFRWVGALSYSLYLWHWPLLVAASGLWGELSLAEGLAVAAASFVPAWLTFRFVENPIRYSTAVSRSPRYSLSLGANFSLVGATAGLVLLLALSTSSPPDITPRTSTFGAGVLASDPRDDPNGAPADDVSWMTPTPERAVDDIPRAHADGCQQVFARSALITCDYGDPVGDIDIAVVGDSKMTQWMPALDLLARQNRWRLVTYLKASCSFSMAMTEFDGKAYEGCREWTDRVLARLGEDPPDYVVTTQAQSKGRDSDGTLSRDAMVEGLRSIWSTLTSRGSTVVVIADNIPPDKNIYECVAENPGRISVCSFPRNGGGGAASVQHDAVEGQPGVSIVDLNDAICPTEMCAPVIGNVLIYRQGSHITATYIGTLTPRLASALSGVGLRADYHAAGN
jgi:peptidoglycan/LPS O-acetylase OafA/YrhL